VSSHIIAVTVRERSTERLWWELHISCADEESGTDALCRYCREGSQQLLRVCARSTGRVATGATVAETERLIREAIELHLTGLREDELPIPQPPTQVEYVKIAV